MVTGSVWSEVSGLGSALNGSGTGSGTEVTESVESFGSEGVVSEAEGSWDSGEGR